MLGCHASWLGDVEDNWVGEEEEDDLSLSHLWSIQCHAVPHKLSSLKEPGSGIKLEKQTEYCEHSQTGVSTKDSIAATLASLGPHSEPMLPSICFESGPY